MTQISFNLAKQSDLEIDAMKSRVGQLMWKNAIVTQREKGGAHTHLADLYVHSMSTIAFVFI